MVLFCLAAGGQFRAPIEKVNRKGWEAIMRTNLYVPLPIRLLNKCPRRLQ